MAECKEMAKGRVQSGSHLKQDSDGLIFIGKHGLDLWHQFTRQIKLRQASSQLVSTIEIRLLACFEGP